MTRAPGPAGDDPEPEGGRAAERLRKMMLERFGTPERPGPPQAGHADRAGSAESADHAAGADRAGGDGVLPLPSRVERPAAAEDPEHS